MLTPVLRTGPGTLRLPVLMWDHENKSNPAASMWVFHNNVRLACCEVYDGLLHQLRGANAEATQAVLQYCEGSDGNDEMDEDLELTQQEQRRRDSTELILALLLRSRQSLIQPIFSVCLSVMALRAGVGVSYWDLLRRLGLVLNKQFTQRFCRAVSERLREQRSEGIDVRVRFVVADNCSYSRKTTHQHVNRDGTRQDTVNWLEVPHGFPMGSIQRGLWHNGSNAICRSAPLRPAQHSLCQPAPALMADVHCPGGSWARHLDASGRSRGASPHSDRLPRASSER